MKFDTIIIGGGISGLFSAISLAEQGKSTALITTGQSALHFSSGSFELLAEAADTPVCDPMSAIDSLPQEHPYRRIGRQRLLQLLPLVQPLFSRAGVATSGNHHSNRYRLTPFGRIKPAWLTLDDFATFDSTSSIPWRSVAIVNIADFQDFYPRFIADGLESHGVKCSLHSTSVPAIDNLRRSATEMRAANIARVLDNNTISQLAGRLNSVGRHADAIIMPAVVGLHDDLHLRMLRRMVTKPLYFISTMPTSVPGVRTQMQLTRYYTKLGGTYLPGDSVTHGQITHGALQRIFTANHSPEPLEADNYILATGSFFSHGLVATPDSIVEPILGLDVDAPSDRALWYEKDIDRPQPFMEFGVRTDSSFHPFFQGTPLSNVRCSGSILGGCNPIKQGCGAGVAILSALNLTIS